MKRTFLFALSFIVLLMGIVVYAIDDSCTTTHTGKGIRRVLFDWQADASGNVYNVGQSNSISGTILGVLFVPDSGVSAPTNSYDVELRDANDFDWLFGTGADLNDEQTSVTNYAIPGTEDYGYYHPVMYGTSVTPYITNAGDGNCGEIHLYTKDVK